MEGALTADQLATELVVAPSELEAYRTGAAAMPVERQLCLALVVIERVPNFAREAHRLRAQVLATIDVEARATAVYPEPIDASRRSRRN